MKPRARRAVGVLVALAAAPILTLLAPATPGVAATCVPSPPPSPSPSPSPSSSASPSPTPTFSLPGIVRPERASATDPCTSTVTVEAKPVVVTWGAKATLSGTLRCSQQFLMQASMVLKRNLSGEDGLHAVASGKTDDNGAYSFADPPSRNAVYRVDWNPTADNNADYLAGTTCAHGTSPEISVLVRPGLILNASASSVARGATARFGGKSVPKRPGERINLQVLQGKSWHDVSTVRLDRNGNYAASYRRATGYGSLLFRIAYPTQNESLTWNVSRTVKVTWS